MRYEIVGGQLPAVKVFLEQDESVFTEAGGMTWMDPCIDMQTEMRGGAGRAIGRMFSGESLFMVNYTASAGAGEIAFASGFPGSIIPLELNGNSWTLQRHAFLLATQGVELKAKVNKNVKKGLFGGEGFVMQEVFGQGLVFIELDGYVECKELAPGQTILVDSGSVAAFESSVTFDTEMIRGAKNVLFGGEGLFNTKLTGPGRVYVQTMTMPRLARDLSPYIATGD